MSKTTIELSITNALLDIKDKNRSREREFILSAHKFALGKKN